MFWLLPLVRSYYEDKGTHEDFPYRRELEEYAAARGLSLVDAFYILVGFTHSPNYSATKMHEHAKWFYQGERDVLKRQLKVHTEDHLRATLQQLGHGVEDKLVFDYYKHKLNSEELKLARLLATYFLHNEEVVLRAGSKQLYLWDYLQTKRPTNPKALNALLRDASFKKIISGATPELMLGAERTYIAEGKLYTDLPIKQSQYEKIVETALRQALVHCLDVPTEIYWYVMQNVLQYRYSRDIYLRFLYFSWFLHTDVRGLLELCGLRWVDQLASFQRTNILMFLQADGTYRVYNRKSDSPNKYIILNLGQLTTMYERGLLRSLAWEGAVPTILLAGQKQHLPILYRTKDMHNFSGGSR